LVLDASLTLAWYFQDEATAATDAVLGQVAQAGAVVPALWRLEVANGFQTAIRRKRIDRAYRDASLGELSLLPISIDRSADAFAWAGTLQLSDRFGISVYDAAYLELAQRRELPLATLDRALGAAATRAKVELIGGST
jgi:predicted nucleic acid-binding protein